MSASPIRIQDVARELSPSLSRRELLYLFGLGAAGLTLNGCGPGIEELVEAIANRRVRRDITSSAAATDLATYKAAVTAMKALPSTDPRSWDAQAQIHVDHCPHGNWLFLPWHRAYLYYFEQICRELTGVADFALPYWNWTTSPSIPDQFWGIANPLDHPRSSTTATPISTGSTGAMVMEGILSETDFFTFGSGPISLSDSQRASSSYGRLESTPHNHIHGYVGGDMATFHSPLDPIFWCHHNMIECCWVDWNIGRGNPNTNDSNWTNRTFTEFVDGTGAPVSITVLDLLFLPLVSYRYDDPIKGEPSTSDPKASRGFNITKSKDEAKDAKRHLEQGADVKLEQLQQVTLAESLSVDLGQPKTLSLAAGTKLPWAQPAEAADQSTRLVLDGVSSHHTKDFFVRAFLNAPNANASTPVTSPHFIGEFSFFGHKHGAEMPKGRFSLNATAALARVPEARDNPVVTLVLVPFEGRDPQTQSMIVERAEFALAERSIR